MKKVLALTAGVLVALAPTGTAFAADSVPVPGKAYGNCKHSSSGGNPHTGLLRPDYNKGNGGLVTIAKAGGDCAPVSAPVVPETAPIVAETAPETPVVDEPVKTDPVDTPTYDAGAR